MRDNPAKLFLANTDASVLSLPARNASLAVMALRATLTSLRVARTFP